MSRKKAHGGDKKIFRETAKKTKAINYNTGVARGGIRF